MDSKQQIDIINEYFEQAYVGASMMDDQDSMTRIGRAIAALNANIEKDIFTEEFNKKYYE